MERGFLGHLGFSLRGDAVGDRHREAVLRAVDADVNVGDLPAVGGVDVVGACRGGAEQVVGGPQQDVVAGPRPGLVGDEAVALVKARVVEEVERLPALARLHPEGRHLSVEVLRAVDVAWIAEVLVVLRGAGKGEAVVAPDGVLDHLDQRVHVDVEALAMEPRLRVGGSHQGSRRRRIEATLQTPFQLAAVEGEEVGALLALDVDDLDELAGGDLVGRRGGPVDPEVEARLGQRRGQLGPLRRPRHLPADLQQQRRGRPGAVDDPASGRGGDRDRLPLGGERLRLPPRRFPAEQPKCACLVGDQALGVQGAEKPIGLALGDQAAKDARLCVRPHPDRRPVLAALGVEDAQLCDLPTIAVDQGQRVAGRQPHRGRRPRPHPVRLQRAVHRAQAPLQQGRSHRGHAQAFAVDASAVSASSTSCAASSRLPSGSSFLTSFSTTRRL